MTTALPLTCKDYDTLHTIATEGVIDALIGGIEDTDFDNPQLQENWARVTQAFDGFSYEAAYFDALIDELDID